MITIISYHELELERAAELQWIELQLHQRLISLIHQIAIMLLMMMMVMMVMMMVMVMMVMLMMT